MRQGLKATAKGAADIFANDLTPNLKTLLGRTFEAELSVTYAVANDDLQKPSAAESNSIENFFAFLQELVSVNRQQFQKGCNSKQLVEMALSRLARS